MQRGVVFAVVRIYRYRIYGRRRQSWGGGRLAAGVCSALLLRRSSRPLLREVSRNSANPPRSRRAGFPILTSEATDYLLGRDLRGRSTYRAGVASVRIRIGARIPREHGAVGRNSPIIRIPPCDRTHAPIRALVARVRMRQRCRVSATPPTLFVRSIAPSGPYNDSAPLYTTRPVGPYRRPGSSNVGKRFGGVA